MESCSLALALPPHASQQLLVGDMRDGAARVDVWALASSTKLDTNKLSWQNKPTREVYLGSLTASYNTTDQLEPFPCRSASYQTFELVCPASGCAVDITSIGEVAIGKELRIPHTPLAWYLKHSGLRSIHASVPDHVIALQRS